MSERNKELNWIFLFSFVLIIFTTIPYFIGFEFGKLTNSSFSGFIFGVEDGNSYIAKMLLGQNGDWLFRTPYTAYDQKGFIAFLPYILIGKLASVPDPHTQLILLFHIFRCLGILYLTYETFYFIKLFIPNTNALKIAVFLSSLGGGLGWLSILLNNTTPLEFYSPESFGFLSIFGLPHLCFSRGLMLRSFRMLLMPGSDVFKLDRKVTSGVYLLLSGLFQPLNIPLGWLLISSWKFVSLLIEKSVKLKRTIKELVYFILIPLPFFIYNALMFFFDPYLKAWEEQNIIKSPPISDYLWAYGVGFICVLLTIFVIKKYPANNLFLMIWTIILPILVYLPFNLQRRLADGYWIVLSIFISIMINNLNKKYVSWIICGLFCLSTLFFYVGSLESLREQTAPVFQTGEIIEIFSKIRENGDPNDVVLAPYYESNLLPAHIPMRVVTGHGPESKNLEYINELIDKFYQGNTDIDLMENLFIQFNVRFVIIKSADTGLSRFNKDFQAEKIFENSQYLLYRIN